MKRIASIIVLSVVLVTGLVAGSAGAQDTGNSVSIDKVEDVNGGEIRPGDEVIVHISGSFSKKEDTVEAVTVGGSAGTVTSVSSDEPTQKKQGVGTGEATLSYSSEVTQVNIQPTIEIREVSTAEIFARVDSILGAQSLPEGDEARTEIDITKDSIDSEENTSMGDSTNTNTSNPPAEDDSNESELESELASPGDEREENWSVSSSDSDGVAGGGPPPKPRSGLPISLIFAGILVAVLVGYLYKNREN